MTEGPKKYFAAIPARALLDRRLDGARFRVLAAIALHDRMGRGQGCWASSETLAGRTGLTAGTVKNCIVDLVKWGYVERLPRPGTKTHRTLFVLYNAEADRAALNGQPVISGNDGRFPNPSFGNDQPVISGNDGKETLLENDIGQSPRERNSAEAATRSKHGDGDVLYCKSEAEFLRRAEDWIEELRNQPYLTDDQFTKAMKVQEELEAIQGAFDDHTGDPIGGWAGRLADELRCIIEEG